MELHHMKYQTGFKEIVVALYRADIKHMTAAKHLGMSLTSFQRRLSGQYPWTLQDMYGLSELLNITTDDWGKLFPNIYK